MDRRSFIKNSAAAAAVAGLPALPSLAKNNERIFYATEKISILASEYELEIEKNEFIDITIESI